MGARTDVAVIGAGPYGLSVGAHLAARGAAFRAFGHPLQTWRTAMPRDMRLKSDGFASNLSAPRPGSLLADYCVERGLPYHPTDFQVPLSVFVDYGLDFQRRHVPDLEQVDVASVGRDGRGFRVVLETGEEVRADRVVAATGITHFAWLPDLLSDLPPERVTHSGAHRDFERFAGKRVTVLGAGASAVNTAVALATAGAHTSLVARASTVHFSSPPPPGGRRTLASRVRRPGSGLGPGWRSRASCDAPDLFRYLPARWRPEIVRRHLGPSSAWHLRSPFEASVELYAGRSLESVELLPDGIRLVLACAQPSSGATSVVLDSEHLVCATGYRADVRRLPFLAPELLDDLRTVSGSPELTREFESSVRGLHFTGLPAAVSFGPLMRFMHGDAFTAARVARGVLRRPR